MKNMDVETKVRQAFEHATPNVLNSVLSDCREQKGTVIEMKERKVNWTRRITAVAAVLALIIGLGAGTVFYRNEKAVAASVSLDVNPSVELQVNRRNRVLAANANNEDGKQILGNMDLSGSDLEVAVNALVGSMVRSGYLSESANSVLVSVDSKDARTGSLLQERLAQVISVSLQEDTFSGAVISQTLEPNVELENKAKEHGISLGKANLIHQIIAQNSHHSFEELVDLSINELKLISQSSAIELEHASELGTASEKEYIGREAALQAALDRAGTTADRITASEIDMDYDDGIMVYEVEFLWEGTEYEYEIDAHTGKVVANSYDREHDKPAQPQVTPESQIDAEAAKQAAFEHARITPDDGTRVKCELDRDDGRIRYEVEFVANGYEYDYEIDAQTGKILKSEKEKAD